MSPRLAGRGRWWAPAGWLVLVAGATGALHAAGGSPLGSPPLTDPGGWGAWLANDDPVASAVALLRLPLLVLGWYATGVVAAGLGVRALRAQGLIGLVDRLTLPPLRRMVVAAAGGLTLASGPTMAAAQAPTTVAVTTTARATVTSLPPPPTLTMRVLAPGESPAPAPPAAPAGPARPAARPPPSAGVAGAGVAIAPSAVQTVPATWTVQPGECFWSIADELVTRAWGRSPTNAEMVPYWRRLIEANRHLLADEGNPDLIYPGQVFQVPPVP